MLLFKKIKMQNFLSVGNTPMEVLLDKSPTTAIIGKNGQGKSTILDAICFSLYGKPYRKINKPDLVNSINNKGLSVEIEFESKGSCYKIIRGIKPNIFEIYENGALIDQNAAVRDYQDVLETNILGMNENAFKQIVLIGSANYVPFMQLDTSKRREVIEDLLDIKIFTTMNILLKGRLSSVNESIKDLESKLSVLTEKQGFYQQQIQKQTTEIASKQSSLQNEIDTINQTIAAAEVEVDKQTQKIADLTLCVTDLYDIELKKQTKLCGALESMIEAESSKKKFFENHDNCPTCSQQISQDHKSAVLSSINQTISKHDNTKNIITQSLMDLEHKSKINKDVMDEIQTLKQTVSTLIVQLKNWNSHKSRLLTELNDLSKQNSFDNELIQIDNEIGTLKTLYDAQIKTKDRYVIVQKLLKDDGIKAKIIEQYVPQINQHVNSFLNKLGLPIQFELDENFDEIIKSRYRDKFKYTNFSEGEKSRIDNALLLTWREIAKSKNTTNTNLLFMDEVFDSSLDANATEELLDILNNYNNTNIFIISHKADITSRVRSVIEIEKHGNFTRIKPQGTP